VAEILVDNGRIGGRVVGEVFEVAVREGVIELGDSA
jgi:hypothetical protein